MLIENEKVLKNFVGNNVIASNLIKSLNNSNFCGVWLLKGPKGIGKSKLASILISEILDIPNKSLELVHPDLFVLKNSTNDKKFISVENVRKVSAFLSKTSIKGKYKSVLIDSLSDINLFGYNALLKTIEDYGKYTNFLLIDHMTCEIPKTINSRCNTFTFKKLSIENVRFLLKKLDNNHDEHHSLSILANGSLGEALSLQKFNALDIHKMFCEFILEKNNLNPLQSIFKKKDNNVLNIYFLLLFRLLMLALRRLNNIDITILTDLEEEVIVLLTKSLDCEKILNLIDNLNNNRHNTINLNLDMYTSIILFLNELKENIDKNAK